MGDVLDTPNPVELQRVTNIKNKGASNRRRRALEHFISAHRLKVSPWAKKAGVSEGTIRNFLMGRSETLTQATVEALAAAVGLAPSDIFPSQDPKRSRRGRKGLAFLSKTPGAFGAKDLPVVGAARKGAGFKIKKERAVRYTERPDYLRGVRTAYALKVLDSSMSPAFERGWLIYVDPVSRVRAGDNVLAELADGHVLLRRLVRRSKAGAVLRQFNPKKDTEVKASALLSVHTVAGVRYRS